MKAPKGWNTARLDQVCDKIMDGTHFSPTSKFGPFKYLTSKNIRHGYIDLSNLNFISEEEHRSIYARCPVRKGDLLLTKDGANTGNAAINTLAEQFSLLSSVAVLRAKTSLTSNRYILQTLLSPIGQALIESEVSGQAITRLTLEKISGLRILVPPLPEQQKIADILGTWDEALEKLDALIAAKARRKQALMQQLLTGHRRLPGSSAPVKFIRASDIFTNRTERNSRGAPILSVTQDQGVVVRATLDRKIAHDIETNDTYKVVQPGDYIISLRSFQGGLECSEILGAVSPAYHVIHPIKDIEREFYRHYFKSADFVSRLAVAVIGIRDGKQISFTDFGFIKLPYPHIEDQKRIGQLLSTADVELRLLRLQRTALDHQKRGLMQQLLTGRIRVAAP
jgi:type I restriction enzyme S subunit